MSEAITPEIVPGLNKKIYSFKHKPNKFQGVAVLKPDDATIGGESTPAKPMIRQAFLDVSMTNRHWGLADIARKAGIDVASLRKREFIMFVNPERTTVALFGYGGTLTYISRRYSKTIGQNLLAQDVLEEISDLYTSEWGCEPKLKSFLRAYLPQGKRGAKAATSETRI